MSTIWQVLKDQLQQEKVVKVWNYSTFDANGLPSLWRWMVLGNKQRSSHQRYLDSTNDNAMFHISKMECKAVHWMKYIHSGWWSDPHSGILWRYTQHHQASRPFQNQPRDTCDMADLLCQTLFLSQLSWFRLVTCDNMTNFFIVWNCVATAIYIYCR